MVEKDTIAKEKVWYVGITNVKAAYEYAYDWLKLEDYKIIEEKYKETVRGDKKDLEIKWTVSKKVTDYFRISVELNWKVLGMEDVEVEIDGSKKKMNKVAELSIVVKGTLEKDYSGKWGVSGFQKFIKEVYDKYIIPTRTEELEQKVLDIVQDFKKEMKAFFELTGRR